MIESLNVDFSTAPQKNKIIDCSQDVAKDVAGAFLLDEYVPMHMRRKNYPFVKKVISTPPVFDSPSSTLSTPPLSVPSLKRGASLSVSMRSDEYTSKSIDLILSGVNKFRMGKSPHSSEKINTVSVPIKLLEAILENKEGIMQNRRRNYTDSLLYIVSIVLRRTLLDRKNSKHEDAAINYRILSSIIGAYKYTHLMNLLINEWGILIKTNDYVKGKNSTRYKVADAFLSDIVTINVRDTRINNALNTFKSKRIKNTRSRNPIINTAIDNSKAINILNEVFEGIKHLPLKQRLGAELSVGMVNSKQFYSTIDTFGDRLHTNFTSLNKHVRPFVRHNGRSLGQVDIGNSQPLFFYIYLRDNCNIPSLELDEYAYLVQNRKFYKFFEDGLGLNLSIKDAKKRIITGVFNDKNRKKTNRYFMLFSSKFPTIAKEIKQLKESDYRFVIKMLQRMESEFIYNCFMKEWLSVYPNTFITTLYDSVVVERRHIKKVYAMMMQCFIDKNIFPTLTFNNY